MWIKTTSEQLINLDTGMMIESVKSSNGFDLIFSYRQEQPFYRERYDNEYQSLTCLDSISSKLSMKGELVGLKDVDSFNKKVDVTIRNH